MLYHLFNWLKSEFNLSGSGLFQYITFRIALATILSLVVSAIIGKSIIKKLQGLQIGEAVRNLGLPGEVNKANDYIEGRYVDAVGRQCLYEYWTARRNELRTALMVFGMT